MKFYKINKILLIFTLCLSLSLEQGETEENEEYRSPCEYINDNKSLITSYEDCKNRSSEYIYEICCFLRARKWNESVIENECVDINRDDKILDKSLNATKTKIMNGTYWDSWNGSYDYIEILDCHIDFIFMKRISILLLFLLY